MGGKEFAIWGPPGVGKDPLGTPKRAPGDHLDQKGFKSSNSNVSGAVLGRPEISENFLAEVYDFLV